MGSRQERGAESQVKRQTLEDPVLRAALLALSQMIDRTRGPHGNIQSLRNNVGGPVTMTTSCNRVLSALSLSHPCLRLIESAIQGHLRTHHDGGLLTTSLCLHLVLNAVKLENVGRVCVREAYSVFLRLLDEYLNAENCPIVVTVDSSNLKVMLGYVRNLLFSKPVTGLNPTSVKHISRLALKAFLTTVPTTPHHFMSDRVYVLQQIKADVMSSEIFEGLLLEWPEKCAQLGPQNIGLLRDDSQEIKVALVNVSMSGDAEEVMRLCVEAQQHIIQSAADLMMRKMLAFCDCLVEKGVGLLLCQKVVHPKVKAYLRGKGILFVERLGLQPMTYLQDLTGATLISSVMVKPADQVWGTLILVEHRVLHGKSYLHLHKADTYVCTLLLCAPMDQQLAELKSAVQSAMTGLGSTFQRPYLLCGGGCWQLHLAAYLRHMVSKRGGELCAELGVAKSQLQACAGAFASSLEQTARSLLGPSFQAWVDGKSHHLWSAPHGVHLPSENGPFSCACGLLSSEDVDRDSLELLQGKGDGQLWESVHRVWDGSVAMEHLEIKDSVNYDWLVLDTMDCGMSAIQTAVLTACTVLSFTHFIHDIN